MLPDVTDKSTESDETIYVRYLINEELKNTKGMTDLARQLGVPDGEVETTRVRLTNIRNGERNAGAEKTWPLFADAYHNGSLDEFRKAARQYASTRRPAPSAMNVYPSRDLALDYMLKSKQASPVVIEQVAQMWLGPNVPDPGSKWWQRRIEEIQHAVESGQAPPPVLGPANTGAAIIIMRRPMDWLGFRQIRDEILSRKDLKRYHDAVIGFSYQLTADDRPEPLDIDKVSSLLDEFIANHPREADPSAWRDWRREARKRIKELFQETAAKRPHRERLASTKLKKDEPRNPNAPDHNDEPPKSPRRVK